MKRSALVRKTPMARGTASMSRAPWKSGAPAAGGPGLAQRVAAALGLHLRHARAAPTMFRSLAHRELVASLSCACCGRVDRSQAAHLNLLALGKGKGLKVSDALLIPLCADEPGQHGCHHRLDQSGIYDKATSETLQIRWLHETRDRLIALGRWPAAAEADMVRLVGAYLARAA